MRNHPFPTQVPRRSALYRWLRVQTVPGRASLLTEIVTLGAAAVGLLVFLLYAAAEATHAYRLHLAGEDWQRAAQPAGLLAMWIFAELHDAGRGRALAVVGFFIAARSTHVVAMQHARTLAQRLGDRVLEVQRS